MNPVQRFLVWLGFRGMAFVRRHYLGMAAGYTALECLAHTFIIGRRKDCRELKQYLRKRYGGESADDTQVILCKNGRSGLCLALKAYFDRGDAVIVNGFTCYAVYEAVKAAGLEPVFADIDRENLNYNVETLEKSMNQKIRGIIVQNSLGNPVDIIAIEKFAKKHNLTIIEDLAHCTGVKYPDGREVGTVGAAAAFSFGKDKSIDTVSGGAVVLREPCKREVKKPDKAPRPSDHLRARFYPLLGVICRGMMVVRAGGVLMRCFVKIHWVERSADNKLDLERKISKFEARLALTQFKNLRKSGEPALREFYLVENRDEVLKELRLARYFFDGLWYERPVSPERYYKKVHFPETRCKEAVFVSEHIINFPTYYPKDGMIRARKIVEKHLMGGGDE